MRASVRYFIPGAQDTMKNSLSCCLGETYTFPEKILKQNYTKIQSKLIFHSSLLQQITGEVRKKSITAFGISGSRFTQEMTFDPDIGR